MGFDKDQKKNSDISLGNANTLDSTNSASMQPPPLQLSADDEKKNSLPNADAIQSAFGTADLSGVNAHSSSAAADSTMAMGAQAFGSGQNVAFAVAPDKNLIAHEAAHIVQQGVKKDEE